MSDKMFDVDVVFTIAVPTEARSAGEAERLAHYAMEYIEETILNMGFEYEVKPIVRGVWK